MRPLVPRLRMNVETWLDMLLLYVNTFCVYTAFKHTGNQQKTDPHEQTNTYSTHRGESGFVCKHNRAPAPSALNALSR